MQLPNGQVVDAAVVVSVDEERGLAVVSIPDGVTTETFAVADAEGETLAPDDTVMVHGDGAAGDVGRLPSAPPRSDEGTPVSDGEGNLLGLCTVEQDATMLMAADASAMRPAPSRPRRRRRRRRRRSTTGAGRDGQSCGRDRRHHQRNRLTPTASPVAAAATIAGQRELLAPLRADHRPPPRLGALDVRLLVGDRRAPALGLELVVGDHPRRPRVAATARAGSGPAGTASAAR